MSENVHFFLWLVIENLSFQIWIAGAEAFV